MDTASRCNGCSRSLTMNKLATKPIIVYNDMSISTGTDEDTLSHKYMFYCHTGDGTLKHNTHYRKDL